VAHREVFHFFPSDKKVIADRSFVRVRHCERSLFVIPLFFGVPSDMTFRPSQLGAPPAFFITWNFSPVGLASNLTSSPFTALSSGHLGLRVFFFPKFVSSNLSVILKQFPPSVVGWYPLSELILFHSMGFLPSVSSLSFFAHIVNILPSQHKPIRLIALPPCANVS